jgi:hypothetical protein
MEDMENERRYAISNNCLSNVKQLEGYLNRLMLINVRILHESHVSLYRYFCGTLKDAVNCYTLEVSFFGYQRPNSPGIFHYTEDACILLTRFKQ